jgi:hypothetical protein
MRSRAPAYWLSPSGNAVPLGGVYQRHIELVLAQPERFGITPSYIKSQYSRFREQPPVEGHARNVILTRIIKSGWVRVRYQERADSWTIQVSKLDRRTNSIIRKWLKTTVSKKYRPAFRIINLKQELLVKED